MQPLPADVVELLRDYLRDKPAGLPIWGGTWGKDWKGAEMLRIDLAAGSNSGEWRVARGAKEDLS